MNVRAMFIDMDGTLLKSSNTISSRNMEAVNSLINQGVKVFLATGRHYEVTAPYHKEIGLRTPMICLNGAADSRCSDRKNDANENRPTERRTIPPSDCCEFLECYHPYCKWGLL